MPDGFAIPSQEMRLPSIGIFAREIGRPEAELQLKYLSALIG